MSATPKDGGPAFPQSITFAPDGCAHTAGEYFANTEGMSLRHRAGHAVLGRPVLNSTTPKPMTPEQLRIACAEACGWRNILRPIDEDYHYLTTETLERVSGQVCGWRHVEGFREPLPDYINDLNACQEMEKVLTFDQCGEYHRLLEEIKATEIQERDGELEYPAQEFWFHIEAEQKCEAFLRVKELEELLKRPNLKRTQPCGCVVCVCEDEERCHGCGAKNFGTDACVFRQRPTDREYDDDPNYFQLRAQVAVLRSALERVVEWWESGSDPLIAPESFARVSDTVDDALSVGAGDGKEGA